MNKEILFIGSVNKGLPPSGGAVAKNQIILKLLNNQFPGSVKNIDISRYRNNFIYLILLLFINFIKYNHIVISTPTPGLKKIAFLNFILKNKKITLFIIGGSLHKELSCPRLRKLLQMSCYVYGETQTLVKKIQKIDSQIQISHLPNFKFIPELKNPIRNLNGEIKLLFISRVHRDKGIFKCFEIIEKLKEDDPHTLYKLDIYGDLGLTSDEVEVFNEYIRSNSDISYKGLLDLRERKGYEILSKYHFMLFLTNHPGEGFPGIILDAMMAQVPIIASDWNYNKEIIYTDKGEMGLIVDIEDDYIQQTLRYVKKLKNDPQMYNQIQELMRIEITKYDAEKLFLQIG